MINNSIFNKFPRLNSERLAFRPISQNDVDDIFFLRSNLEVINFLDTSPHQNRAESIKFIKEGVEKQNSKQALIWGIFEKTSDIFIGDFSFWDINHSNHEAEIGYSLKPDFWNNGFMTETLATMLKFGFNEANFHRIKANINPKNENSKKLLLKCGFKKEGLIRENHHHNGNYFDSEVYGLLKEDLKF